MHEEENDIDCSEFGCIVCTRLAVLTYMEFGNGCQCIAIISLV